MSDPATSAIAARWRALRGAEQPALIPYLTAGYPSRDLSVAALRMAADEGADFIEVGIPFSDPLADGPVIQHSTQEALAGGMTVGGALEVVRSAALSVPVIAFTYLNPILAYGPERFLADAAAAGVAGLLLTDLPAGADPELEALLHAGPLDLIRLLAPTSSPERLAAATAGAEGFLYLIARLGVTGARTEVDDSLAHTAAAIRAISPLPIAVGFGIGSGAQAQRVAAFADGVVVGSALVKRLGRSIDEARALMRELREALAAAPHL